MENRPPDAADKKFLMAAGEFVTTEKTPFLFYLEMRNKLHSNSDLSEAGFRLGV